jgi:hypothetical protein
MSLKLSGLGMGAVTATRDRDGDSAKDDEVGDLNIDECKQLLKAERQKCAEFERQIAGYKKVFEMELNASTAVDDKDTGLMVATVTHSVNSKGKFAVPHEASPLKEPLEPRSPRRKKRQREEQFDEQVNQSQTEHLSKRMIMSSTTLQTTFPDYAKQDLFVCSSAASENKNKKQYDEVNSSGSFKAVPAGNAREDALLRRQHNIAERDSSAVSALEISGEVDQLREERDRLLQACKILQEEILEAQAARSSVQKDADTGNASNTSGSTNSAMHRSCADDNDHNALQCLQQENKKLKGILVSLISSSGIDWFSDPHLRYIMTSLEEMDASEI